VIANDPLTVLIESCWKPERASIGERAKAGVEMVETWIDQFD